MRTAEEIVDTSLPPGETVVGTGRHWLRLLIPGIAALLLVAAIVGITLHNARVNREDALRLTEDLIQALETAVQREVQAYLAGPRAVARFMADIADGGIAGEPVEDAAIERVMRTMMRRVSTIGGIFIGDAEGDFLMVQRDEGTERLVTKFVANRPDARVVRLQERDGEDRLVDERIDPDDAYDPRTRGWFRDAVAHPGLRWSDVYRFFTTGELGITASVRADVAPGVRTTVAGVDLELAAMGRFLDRVDLGAEGRVAVIQTDGRLIAFPSGRDWAGDVAAFGEAALHLEALGDPALNQAFQRFRVGGQTRSIALIGDARYIVSASSLAAVVGRDWWLLMVVPESQFVGFVADNARRSLFLSLAVVALAVLAAGILTYQGVQADARVARARRAERAIQDQGRVLAALGRIHGLADPHDDASLEALVRVAADALGARRLGVWRLDVANRRLLSLEIFDQETRGHTAAAALPADHLGPHWEALVAGRSFVVEATETSADPLVRFYLAPSGTRELRSLPVVGADGKPAGALWLEDAGRLAARTSTTEGIAELVAGLVAPRLRRHAAEPLSYAATREAPSAVPARGSLAEVAPEALRRADIRSQRERGLLRAIHDRLGGEERLAAAVFPRLAVLSLRFGDDLALAARAGDGGSLLEGLVARTAAAAERHGVRYLKLLGDEVVAADDFDGDAAAAAKAIASLALDLQILCRESFAPHGGTPAYRIGIDVASAMGASTGFGDAAFDLWGDAVRLAGALSASAPSTSIQVSESAYEVLKTDYLLRRRGSFFIADVGAAETFVLVGTL